MLFLLNILNGIVSVKCEYFEVRPDFKGVNAVHMVLQARTSCEWYEYIEEIYHHDLETDKKRERIFMVEFRCNKVHLFI